MKGLLTLNDISTDKIREIIDLALEFKHGKKFSYHSEKKMATIAVEDSENLEKAIKRFKRMVEKEGIIREYKKREYFVKPSATLHQKKTTLERKLLNKKRQTTKKEY